MTTENGLIATAALLLLLLLLLMLVTGLLTRMQRSDEMRWLYVCI